MSPILRLVIKRLLVHYITSWEFDKLSVRERQIIREPRRLRELWDWVQ